MNPELLLKHYIAPMYISTTNMVVPIAKLTFNSLYDNVVEFGTFAWQTLAIFVHTFVFIAKEAFEALNNNLSFTEKILLILCLYNFIAFSVSEIGWLNEQQKLQEKIEKMEKDVNSLRKSNSIRDSCDQVLGEEILEFNSEVRQNLQNLEKELINYKEKLDDNLNNINEHQRNEQIIFQKMAQLSKEIRKMKKEMDKLA